MGVGGTTNSFEAPAVPNSHNVKVIAANGDNSLALTADGAVCAWGLTAAPSSTSGTRRTGLYRGAQHGPNGA